MDKQGPFHTVLGGYPAPQHYFPVDLSSANEELTLDILQDAQKHWEWFLERFRESGKKVAYGGYLERRKLYERSDYFSAATKEEDKRCIHLGLDFWCPAGTEVIAPIDGVIHSFQNNTNFGDYGPTIILEHIKGNHQFFTLYGHLSLESLENKTERQRVQKGEIIATLGTPDVNGDYAPHLHFQIIKDMHGKRGDYPGVCSLNELAFFKENCPDPSLLLGMNP